MRNLKKVLALVLVLALSLTMFAGAIETVLPFNDVNELTAEQLDALKLLYALGVIKGNDEGSSNPNGTYTRAELAATLYRLYTGDAEEKYVSTYSSTSPYFADSNGAWYTPYVNWAYLKGVILGYGDGNFGPNDPVTGVQAATMLARLLGYEVEGENWDITARKIAIENRLDAGVESKDLFNENLTRGDMFVMVANTLKKCEVGSRITLAEKIFDLEIIEGAILLGADKLGSTPYSVFAFKDLIAGNVKYFITDLLSIEEKPTTDEIGQKYTLYVAKTKEVNGYKVLYAAYEEDRENNAYYSVVEGIVDDGKLNTTNPNKADYLLKLLDDYCIAYINGVPTKADKNEAFAAFAASYGVANGAAYKLIDNDGDGKYEYIIVYRLTFDMLTVSEVVANVVSYNTLTGAYTLSDGNTYFPGQYWKVDANKNWVGVYDVTAELENAIGSGSYTASPVQYKFTVATTANASYIMKVEVCDATNFSGNYVLGLGVVGTSTYKGAQYVKFLTEDNTTLYAYVTKVNHQDVRVATNFNDNNPFTDGYYNERLFYVNAYGDDCVELLTVAYINSNAVYQDYNWGWQLGYDTENARSTSFNIINGKGLTFYADFPSYGYKANDRTYYYVDAVNAPTGKTTYYYDGTTKTYTTDSTKSTDGKLYNITPQYYFDATVYKGFYEGNEDYNNTKWLAYTINSEAYDAVKIPVKVVAIYETNNMQIFKAYGKWYMQEYGIGANSMHIDYIVYFGDVEVRFDIPTERWIAPDGSSYNTGVTDPLDIYNAVQAALAALDNTYVNIPIDAAGNAITTYWEGAQVLNVTKGVVFAYGSIANTWNYTWKAYNLDEFDVAFFGTGLPLDDRDPLSFDEAVITTIDGQKYVKAAKVTVDLTGNNIALPLTKILANGTVFIYDKVAGSIDINGRTVISHEPNGGSSSYYLTFDLAAGVKDGDFVYVTKDESGKIVSAEILTNILDVMVQNQSFVNGKTGASIAADGTVTVDTWYLGIKTSSKLDLTKTFFAHIDVMDVATRTVKYGVCDAAKMADLVNNKGYEFRIWTLTSADGTTYNFVLAVKSPAFWTIGKIAWDKVEAYK